MTKPPELKPCPFCEEGKTVSTYFDPEQGDKWGYASCDACGARGPEVRTDYDCADNAPWRTKAIAAWNNRTPDPAVQALVDIASIASAHLHQLARDRDLSEGELDFMRRVDAALAAFDNTKENK